MASTSSSSAGIYQYNDVFPPRVSPNHPRGDLNQLINEVRSLVQTTAPNGFSRDDGVDISLMGAASDVVVPLFFRCTWPLGTQTRHKLIWMKPSIPKPDFGRVIVSNFQIIETGGAVRQMPATYKGRNPFTSRDQHYVEARRWLNCEVGEGDYPTNEQHIKMLGYAMNGFFEIIVQPLHERANCLICRGPYPLFEENLKLIAVLVGGEALVCDKCAATHKPEEIRRFSREWSIGDTHNLAQQQFPAGFFSYTLGLGTIEYCSRPLYCFSPH